MYDAYVCDLNVTNLVTSCVPSAIASAEDTPNAHWNFSCKRVFKITQRNLS